MRNTMSGSWVGHPLRADADALVWRHGGPARTGWLTRFCDESGVSGVGQVAEVVQCKDGTCVLAWRPVCDGCGNGVSVFGSESEVLIVHGHGGLTEISWQ